MERSKSTMVWLDESASGLRHLRWAREIHATLEGHLALERGAVEERRAWQQAAARLADAIAVAREPVKRYRDFLERVRVKSRGVWRAAALGSERERAASALRAIDAGERASLGAEVRAAVRDLRREIAAVMAQLESCSGGALTANLFPELTPDRQRVLDVADDDDDATAPG